MGFKALDWYCSPVKNGVWTKSVDNAFGPYTPCGLDTLVVNISHLAMMGICLYRVWRLRNDFSLKRYRLKSAYYNYFLSMLAAYATAVPVYRLVMGVSIFNLDGQYSIAPFEKASLLVEAFSWCCVLTMTVIETKIYIRELRWYVRFGVLYCMVGDIVMFNLLVPFKSYIGRSAFLLYCSEVFCQLLYGIFLTIYVPNLDPYFGYNPVQTALPDRSTEYQELPGGEQICPERHVSVFSRIYFVWMTTLMELGYQRPITEKDVWKLDSWDQTEVLYSKFQSCWLEESVKPKPWLLRALNRSLGARFWLGGLFKDWR